VRIKDATGAALTVYLTPDDCLLLAEACHQAAQNYDDDAFLRKNPTVAHLFDVLQYCFEGYATVGQAIANSAPADLATLDLAYIRNEWGILPGDRKAS